MSRPSPRLPAASALSASIALLLSTPALAQSVSDDARDATELDTVRVTAEAIARQALGTSVITVEDIERRPPANDLSELIRTMPGVNLTGNSSSGQYGNHRQIDLRGMGPENTLILVDGKPVGSRDSIRMGRSGERNTRGDTNWVPAEAVERIEVLRGPAAARYGSGASGGVVNIITKRPTGDLTGSLSLYGQVPQHGAEGGSQRAGVTLSGPLKVQQCCSKSGRTCQVSPRPPRMCQGYATKTSKRAPNQHELRRRATELPRRRTSAPRPR